MSIEDTIKETLAAQGIKEKVNEEVVNSSEAPVSSNREYTEFEKEQMAKGWNPDGVKSAEEYARTEPLYEELKNRGKEIKRMQKTLDALTAHMNKQEKIAYEKALATLSQEKEDAIARGDSNAVKYIEQEQTKLMTPQQQSIPEVEAFTEKYDEIFKSTGYEEMQIAQFVMQRDRELASKGLTPAQHMATLEEHMVKQFPNYFNKEETVSKKASGVESGTGSGVQRKTTKEKYTFHDLTKEQQEVAVNFERYGIMSKDDYIKSIFKSQ